MRSIPGDRVPAVHLRPAGDAGEHRQAPPLERCVALQLVRETGPGADQAHLAAHDVDQLRRLVEAEAAKETSHTGDARIVLEAQDAGALLLGADDHGSKLDEGKRHGVPADALLHVEHGPARGQLDGHAQSGTAAATGARVASTASARSNTRLPYRR